MQVLELKGYKALRAFNAFHSLMLGMKMLPMYAMETYEAFFARVEQMSESEQDSLIRQAILFVELSKDEVESIISFVQDKNGVAYGPANLKNLNPSEIHEIIAAVCMEMLKIKVTLVSSEEKKN